MTSSEKEEQGFEIDSTKLPSVVSKPKLVYALALWALFGVVGQVFGFATLALSSLNVPQNIEVLLLLVFTGWLLIGILKAHLGTLYAFGVFCVVVVIMNILALVNTPSGLEGIEVYYGLFLFKIIAASLSAYLVFRPSFVSKIKEYEKHKTHQNMLKASQRALAK